MHLYSRFKECIGMEEAGLMLLKNWRRKLNLTGLSCSRKTTLILINLIANVVTNQPRNLRQLQLSKDKQLTGLLKTKAKPRSNQAKFKQFKQFQRKNLQQKNNTINNLRKYRSIVILRMLESSLNVKNVDAILFYQSSRLAISVKAIIECTAKQTMLTIQFVISLYSSFKS